MQKVSFSSEARSRIILVFKEIFPQGPMGVQGVPQAPWLVRGAWGAPHRPRAPRVNFFFRVLGRTPWAQALRARGRPKNGDSATIWIAVGPRRPQ